MFTRVIAFAALLCGAAFAQEERGEKKPPAPIVTIDLREQASVLGANVQLRDVAVVEASYAPLRTKLENVSLGGRPQSGFRRSLARDRIAQILRDEGLQPELVSWTGASRCVVDSQVSLIDPQRILATAEPAALAALRALGVNHPELEPLSVPRDIHTAPGRQGRSLHARVIPGSDQRSIVTILVDVRVDGVVEETIEQQFRVFRMQEVLLPLRDIDRGEALHAGMFAMEHTRVRLGDRSDYVLSDQIDGRVATRTIARGRPVQSVDVRLPWLVRRNEPVKIVERKGVIEISMQGTALRNGSLGEAITVRKSDGGILRVYVISAGLVSTRPLPQDPQGGQR